MRATCAPRKDVPLLHHRQSAPQTDMFVVLSLSSLGFVLIQLSCLATSIYRS
ncbi:hypothetical protein LZ32DRAFT_413767 [Colletotrichum eremochloae]|nr:hypothetical protein LZ32DRAFT_413767 [Colletotrichum eremochloae]